jgi:hypothetical protein
MSLISRKQFLLRLAGAGAAIAAAPLLTACGGDDDSDDGDGTSAGDCLANGTQVSIGSNHGHVLAVSIADVEAGVEQSYQIMGSSPHPHTVTLTAAHFAMLQAGTSVTVVSSTDSQHSHSITITCA